MSDEEAAAGKADPDATVLVILFQRGNRIGARRCGGLVGLYLYRYLYIYRNIQKQKCIYIYRCIYLYSIAITCRSNTNGFITCYNVFTCDNWFIDGREKICGKYNIIYVYILFTIKPIYIHIYIYIRSTVLPSRQVGWTSSALFKTPKLREANSRT